MTQSKGKYQNMLYSFCVLAVDSLPSLYHFDLHLAARSYIWQPNVLLLAWVCALPVLWNREDTKSMLAVSLEPHFLAKLHFSHQESMAYWATIVINNKQFPSAVDFVLNVPTLYWVKSDQWLKLLCNHHSVSVETTKWQNWKGKLYFLWTFVCLFVCCHLRKTSSEIVL